MAWQDVPTFYETLGEVTVTHLALRLLILTGARSGPLRHMSEDHIDGDIWIIPADLMKGRRDATAHFRIPLSDEAMRVVEQAHRLSRSGHLFAATRRGVLSDMAMARHM